MGKVNALTSMSASSPPFKITFTKSHFLIVMTPLSSKNNQIQSFQFEGSQV